MKPGVLLYEPRHRSARLPLSLLHVASALEARVLIVDGRLEMAPAALVAELAKEALCLAVTAPSGPALGDALEVTRGAKAARASLPVVWGGPHATFRPAECLASGVVDACVLGPGERTLAEVVDALGAGGTDTSIPGLAFKRGEQVVESLPRAREDVDDLPPVDYSLLDLERHFSHRSARRAEVSASRGGGRSGEEWSGLAAERVLAVVAELVRRHGAREIVFVDQGFFTDPPRVVAIARGLLGLGEGFAWEASTELPELRRALSSLDLALLKRSGARRITVWAEGSEAPEIHAVAETLARAGLLVCVRFILGRPGEDEKAPREAHRAARALLLAPGASVSVEMRLFEPWPGCAEAEALLAAGAEAAPSDLQGWSAFDPEAFARTWLEAPLRRRVPRWSFYLEKAAPRPRRRFGQRALHRLARLRLRARFYGLDLERRAVLGLRRLKAALRLESPGPVED
jgi:hypothetical protein